MAADRLSSVVHKDEAVGHARWLVDKLHKVIPRQMFKVAIQAVVGGKVVASQHIAPFRKGKLKSIRVIRKSTRPVCGSLN